MKSSFAASTPSDYLAAAGVCAFTTLVATPLLDRIDLANIALLFVLAVVVAAARWGRGAGVFAAFAAVACFDFFFVPPRFSLTVAHAQYLIVFAVMLVVSLVISHLTHAVREKAAEADRRAGEAGFLYTLAADLSGALTHDEVTRRLAAATERQFGVRDLKTSDPALAQAVAALVDTAVERIHSVELAQASQLDMQSERLRNTILSTLSHDLRTPLTVLYGLADTLARRTDLPTDAAATAGTLCEQSLRLHRMVDNLLDLARLRSGRVTLHRDWQSMSELVGASVQAMAPWLPSARVRIKVSAELPLVEVDAQLFERVLCNLLENAAKYSPPDSPIEIDARVETGDGTAQLVLTVGNVGPGFPDGAGNRVFDWFERGDADTRPPGSGVGLAVCRAIVEAHDGCIESANRPGGAEIRLGLPLRTAPPVATEPDDADDAANHG